MHPTSPKRLCFENSSDNCSQNVAALPDDIVRYLGRFIVKHPVLHLFLLASHHLAECAKTVFSDFANAGESLDFISKDPGIAVTFAKTRVLRTLNLIKFDEIPEEDCEELFAEAYQISQLAIRNFSWVSAKLSSLTQLTSLQLVDYGEEDLSFISKLQALQVLRLNFLRPTPTPLNFMHSLRRLTRLEICDEVIPDNVNLPLFTTLSSLVDLKLETLLPQNLPQQLARLSSLKTLSLEFCDDETEEPSEKIAAAYLSMSPCFTNLTQLKLENSSSVAWGFTSILEWLTNLETLRLADVTHQEDPEILETSFRKISRLSNLTVLKMSDLRLNKTLSESLGHLGPLRTLELSNGITDQDIAFGFLEAMTALQTLVVSGQALSSEHFHIIGKLTNLAALHLADFTLTQTTIDKLTTLTRLTTLSLVNFTADESAVSFQPLTNLVCLNKIKLTCNAQVPSLPLQAIPYLSRLELTSGAENEDITSIVNHTCTLTQLRRLIIRSPELSLTDIRSLSEKLSFLEKLTLHAELFCNDFKTLRAMQKILKSKQIRLKKK